MEPTQNSQPPSTPTNHPSHVPPSNPNLTPNNQALPPPTTPQHEETLATLELIPLQPLKNEHLHAPPPTTAPPNLCVAPPVSSSNHKPKAKKLKSQTLKPNPNPNPNPNPIIMDVKADKDKGGYVAYTKKDLTGIKAFEYLKIRNSIAKWVEKTASLKICRKDGKAVGTHQKLLLVFSHGERGEVTVSGHWTIDEYIADSCKNRDTSVVVLKRWNDSKLDFAELKVERAETDLFEAHKKKLESEKPSQEYDADDRQAGVESLGLESGVETYGLGAEFHAAGSSRVGLESGQLGFGAELVGGFHGVGSSCGVGMESESGQLGFGVELVGGFHRFGSSDGVGLESESG
ncbi:hypothetical protein Tco_0961521 [Tanacetum coccineum]